MAAETECSTSGRPEPTRFTGGTNPGSLLLGRTVQPKRFLRQQVWGRVLLVTLRTYGWYWYLMHLYHTDIQIPDAILLNEDLSAAIAVLPVNYSFEVGTS